MISCASATNMGGLLRQKGAKKSREVIWAYWRGFGGGCMTLFTANKVPLIHPNGFREYDARWLYPKDIDLAGMRVVGLGLGTLLHERGRRPDIVSGHDYRSYSEVVQGALIDGLVEAGCIVHDIGLGVTPL